MPRGTIGFPNDLIKQGDACRRSSSLYGVLMVLLGKVWEDTPEFRAFLDQTWKDRAFSVWYERPLLLALVLHDLALEHGADFALSAAYPSCGGNPEALTLERVRRALTQLYDAKPAIEFLRKGSVQTNETSRGIVWIWPLAELFSRLSDRLLLFDLGASAGLNLIADQMPSIWADGKTSKPLRITPLPKIAARIGYDREPVDLKDAVAVRRLRAAIWADDLVRLARLDRAVGIAQDFEKRGELRLEKVDLLRMPEKIMEEVRKSGDLPAVIYHSVTTDYLTTEKRDEFERYMRDLLHRLPVGSLWIEFESSRAMPGVRMASDAGPMELRAHWNVGGLLAHETLARAAPHPITLSIDHKALNQLLS